MAKLLISSADGLQSIVDTLTCSGGFDPAFVLWDERTDGAIPSFAVPNLGSLVRVNGAVQVASDPSQLLSALQMMKLRFQRNALLASCDWTQMADSPLSSDQKAAWANYREQLRQLPDQPGIDPTNPTWPVQP